MPRDHSIQTRNILQHDVAIGPDQALLTKLAGIARKACHADALSLAVA